MVTYKQYAAALATLKRLAGGELDLTTVHALLSKATGDDKTALISALKTVGSVEDPEKLKAEHQALKIKSQKPVSKPQVKAKPLNIKTQVANVLKAFETQSGSVKSLVSSDVSAQVAVEEFLQKFIIDRARTTTGIFSDINIVPATSVKFRPAPLSLTRAQAAKAMESDGTQTFEYTQTATGTLVQPLAALSGFMGVFSASTEAISDPAINLVEFVQGQLADDFVENFAEENLFGDSSMEELGGIFTVHADADNGYAEMLKPHATRHWNTFGGMSSGTADKLGADSSAVVDNLNALISMLPAKYHADAKFYMNPETHRVIKQLKDTAGAKIFTGSVIEDFPVVLDEQMPLLADADNKIAISFGIPAEAMGLGLIDTLLNVNPYKFDGQVQYSEKSRMVNFIKSNTALVNLIC